MTTARQNLPLAKVKPNWDFWGLIDLRGNYVLEPIWKEIYAWKDGMARLEKVSSRMDHTSRTDLCNGQYGFVNTSGKMITDLSFGNAADFSNGLAAVAQNGEWGFIDKDGQLVVPYRFEHVRDFGNEGCIVSLDNKWGLIGRDGQWKLENNFERLSDFAFGMAVAVVKNKTTGKGEHPFIIDSSGNKIVDLPKEWGWFKPVSEKLILIGTSSGYPGERFYGFMDLQGRIKSQPQFYTTSDTSFDTGQFREGKLWVETKDGRSGYVNEEGEFEQVNASSPVIRLKEDKQATHAFDEVLNFSEGLAVARQGDHWGVIDANSRVVIDFRFRRRIVRSTADKGLFFSDYFPQFSCGLIGICEERDTIYSGYMDKEGKTAIGLQFRIAQPFYSFASPDL
jgi:hypothetical protein